MAKRFLRRGWNKISKLGKGRKKKQKWRRPKGRHNKMRERRKGYAKVVDIGHRKKKENRTSIANMPRINNIKELLRLKKEEGAIIGNVGKRKKAEIAKKAAELNINIVNLNVKRFLKNIENANKEKIENEKKNK